ncbi:hypothetical protein B9Z55_004724 [Caenorhabditis nigoni]|nr:hypothetical protein B9Z55_004724 [Caenorhabditis nigoni]
MYAGNAVKKVKNSAPIKLLTFRGTAFEPAKEGEGGAVEKAPSTDIATGRRCADHPGRRHWTQGRPLRGCPGAHRCSQIIDFLCSLCLIIANVDFSYFLNYSSPFLQLFFVFFGIM